MADDEGDQPQLVPVASKPISLVPVGLKEAALDSPTFRATAVHFFDQVDALEKWLQGLVNAISKVSQDLAQFESHINGVGAAVIPPPTMSEAILDQDYTLLAAQRYNEVAKAFWGQAFASLRKLEANMADPVKSYIQNDLRHFRELRRQLDSSRNAFDQVSARYAGLLKSKEPSAIREEAFHLHEARKVYLKASLDISIAAPQLRISLDKVLVKAFHEEGRTMWKAPSPEIAKWASELDRVRGWVREMELGEKDFRRDLISARKQYEESTEQLFRPSRELDDYAQSSASATLLTKGPAAALPSSKPKPFEKQGWLYIRTLTGKPARTAWLRRWFYVKNGLFGCLVQGSRSGGVEESERIGVLLCGIRAASSEERRFCFEVKTKDITLVLQAESQQEMVNWMGTFDLAKQKALEDPESTESFSDSTSSVLDPAFAITPPSAPEFTASAADAGLHATTEEGHDRNVSGSLTLPVSDSMPSLHRGSFDVTSSRRSTAMDGVPESRREQLKQKLGKTTTGLSSSGNQSSGIASLISATHASMPIGPGATTSQPSEQPVSRPAAGAKPTATSNRTAFLARTMPPSSLAPATLAAAPAITNLSSTAVAVNGERGVGVGIMDNTGGMPSGMLANLWGSTNWGYVNRFERGEVKPSAQQRGVHDPVKPVAPQRQSTVDSAESMPVASFPSLTSSITTDGFPASRKAASIHGDGGELQKSVTAPSVERREFPNYYPVQLKYQDSQFRLLFPSVKRMEKLVIVFRATWVPNEHQEFPGRAYVTAEHIFFYSNHLGLVLVTGFALNQVTEVNSAQGKDCDYLFLHMKGASNEPDFARLTIKSFLNNVKLLERRLNYLVRNCGSAQPDDLESIMKQMIRIESEADDRSPSNDSFDELDGIESLRRHHSQKNKNLRTKILVDQGLSSSISSLTGKDAGLKFKLPNKPVIYVPRGMSIPVVERTYDISPKALFHLLFGDRSAVWQLMYHERRAYRIRQGPWVQSEKAHTRRAFEYDVELHEWLGTTRQALVTDTQIIDVHNEHLCYVVTDRKTPWHLPYHTEYMLVTKVVITYEPKSRSKLALYTRVDWNRSPFILGALLERHALGNLQVDACDLADVVSEQVRKLGAFSQTKKAINIFGSIGEQTQTVELQDIETSAAKHSRRITRRSMLHLIFSAVTNLNANLIASVVALCLNIVRWVWQTIGIHKVLLAVLLVSMFTNLMMSSRESGIWWRERHARNYMRQLGIGRDLVMNKAIHIHDIDLATTLENFDLPGTQNNSCFQTFMSTSTSDTTLRSPDRSLLHMQRSRQRLGSYRHDLMVAMRVVNRVEKEILRGGWEDWLLAETQRCDSMRQLLVAKAKVNATEAEDLRSRLDEYCNSCRLAQEGADSSTQSQLEKYLPRWYHYFFLYIEPTSCVAGAFVAIFRQFDYLALTDATSAPPPMAIPLGTSISLTQLGNLYLLFAIAEALVLRATDDPKVWRAFLIALLIGDLGHLYSVGALGWEVYYDVLNYNAMDWGSVPFVYLGATTRTLYLLGYGQEQLSPSTKAVAPAKKRSRAASTKKS